ncbi:hypothetical protein GCM10009647_009410 [Streptomyces sanglieri]|uniref:Uncharacterized protein n=1 Tax=Streptomyces sanglieri TaxID=193460 RepID=A0ABW2X0L9_9ACTN|nr:MULTISPECIES: hypothetical protein [Streptomyces]MCT2541403.1 hypothetical protein [Streptomyces atratus]MDV9202515.1 hypothetical protein [Streptomyces sp. Wh19]
MTQPAPAQAQESLPLDSTAQLLTRITAQLGTQLCLVTRNGTRRSVPADGRPRDGARGVSTGKT